MRDYLHAREAAELLGVKLSTLYAYASRGRVRTLATHARTRLYATADLIRLKARHDARAGHGPVAAGAMHWGEAVLDTSVSTFDPRGPIYRGQLATELAARGSSFESVAELLWTGELGTPGVSWPVSPLGALKSLAGRASTSFLSAMLSALPALSSEQTLCWEPPEILSRARSLIAGMALAPALERGAEALEEAARECALSRRVLRALGKSPRPETVGALDQCLVLCADHELNPSSFVARIAASAGADLEACVTAALATLSGRKHGGLSARVEQLVVGFESVERAREHMRESYARGAEVPGFGHPMYPSGDPRAMAMLRLAEQIAPEALGVRCVVAMAETAHGLEGEPPSLDVGLVALAMAMELPRGGAGAIFAVGRAAGWVAHAIEQHATGVILRPRARYLGRIPPPAPGELSE